MPFWIFGPYGCPHNISDYNHHLFLLFGISFRHLNGWLAFIKKIPEEQNFKLDLDSFNPFLPNFSNFSSLFI